MKKVLSLVLAVMLVFGMATVAFANDYSYDWSAESESLNPGTTESITINLAAAIEARYFATPRVGASVSLVVNNKTSDKAWQDAISSAKMTITKLATATTQGTVRVDIVVKSGAKNIDAGGYLALTLGDDEIQIIMPKLTARLATVPTGWKITGFNDSWNDGWGPVLKNGIVAPNYVDGEDRLPIYAGMFTWTDKDGDAVSDIEVAGISRFATVRSSQLSNANIGVRRVYQKGTANTIRDVTFQDSDSRIRVRTVQHYVKTSGTDVELKLALTYRGVASTLIVYDYSFKIENTKVMVEEGQTDAYSSGHIFLEADATVRNLEFEGDEDGLVYATKTVVKGQKYYFNVDAKNLTSSDEEVLAKYPEVDSIYNVFQVNMANATVQFKDLDREYFVYNEAGKLLGTTKDKTLPLAAKYILTTSKIDFGGAAVTEEPAEESSEATAPAPEAPNMGGGEAPAAGTTNYNPNTGL